MAKQKTVIEYGDQNKRFRAQMEQSLTHFDVNDVYKAIECLLDVYGGTGLDVLTVVKYLLVDAAVRRFDLKKDAGEFLGRPRYVTNYYLYRRNAREHAKLFLDFAAGRIPKDLQITEASAVKEEEEE